MQESPYFCENILLESLHLPVALKITRVNKGIKSWEKWGTEESF